MWVVLHSKVHISTYDRKAVHVTELHVAAEKTVTSHALGMVCNTGLTSYNNDLNHFHMDHCLL